MRELAQEHIIKGTSLDEFRKTILDAVLERKAHRPPRSQPARAEGLLYPPRRSRPCRPRGSLRPRIRSLRRPLETPGPQDRRHIHPPEPPRPPSPRPPQARKKRATPSRPTLQPPDRNPAQPDDRPPRWARRSLSVRGPIAFPTPDGNEHPLLDRRSARLRCTRKRSRLRADSPQPQKRHGDNRLHQAAPHGILNRHRELRPKRPHPDKRPGPRTSPLSPAPARPTSRKAFS